MTDVGLTKPAFSNFIGISLDLPHERKAVQRLRQPDAARSGQPKRRRFPAVRLTELLARMYPMNVLLICGNCDGGGNAKAGDTKNQNDGPD